MELIQSPSKLIELIEGGTKSSTILHDVTWVYADEQVIVSVKERRNVYALFT